MDRDLLGESLPESFSLLDKGIPRSSSGSIDCGAIAMFVTFGAESFVKRPSVLITEGVQRLRLDGLLTLIAITHGNLGGLMKLTRCPEQMKEKVRKLDTKKATDSWNKIRDLRHTLIQYLLQQNHFGTGEGETNENVQKILRVAL